MENIYLKNRVLAADAVELIHLLYEHAIGQVISARAALASGDIAARSTAVSKTVAILGELEGSLDHDSGGSLSQNLASLYQYMRRRLVDANIKKDADALTEVESLLQTLDDGWTTMQKLRMAQSAEPAAHMIASGPVSRFAMQSEGQLAHAWDA